jgi:glutaredoxin
VSEIEVELLVVPGCPHAAEAQQLLRSALLAAGLPRTPIRVNVIESQREAEQRGFIGSPTILINGVDPFAEPGRRPPGLACRIYPGPAHANGLPQTDQLQNALYCHRDRHASYSSVASSRMKEIKDSTLD